MTSNSPAIISEPLDHPRRFVTQVFIRTGHILTKTSVFLLIAIIAHSLLMASDVGATESLPMEFPTHHPMAETPLANEAAQVVTCFEHVPLLVPANETADLDAAFCSCLPPLRAVEPPLPASAWPPLRSTSTRALLQVYRL